MIADLRTRIAGIAKRAPNAQALLACGRKTASYHDLLHQMNGTARWLALKGIGRADRVAVVMPNGPEMASLFLGVASVSTCAPLNPAYRANEFEFYLSDLKPKLVIVDAAMESAVDGVARAMDIEVVKLRRRVLEEAGSFELGPEREQAIPMGQLNMPRKTMLRSYSTLQAPRRGRRLCRSRMKTSVFRRITLSNLWRSQPATAA